MIGKEGRVSGRRTTNFAKVAVKMKKYLAGLFDKHKELMKALLQMDVEKFILKIKRQTSTKRRGGIHGLTVKP